MNRQTVADQRRALHTHSGLLVPSVVPGERFMAPAEVVCGNCGRSWCETCDPAPSALCHWCHGVGRPASAIVARRRRLVL